MKIFNYLYKKLLSPQKYISFLRKQGVKIGNNCEIYKSANFGSEPYLIEIGDNVRINHGVQLITHDGGLWVLRNHGLYKKSFTDADKFGKILIGNNVHIGTNSIIMPGITIGDNVIIGCGAVVTHNVPSSSVWGGVPARHIETLDEYAEKLKKKTIDTKHMSKNEKKKFLMDYYGKN